MYAGKSDILMFLLCVESRMLEFKILICMYIRHRNKSELVVFKVNIIHDSGILKGPLLGKGCLTTLLKP